MEEMTNVAYLRFAPQQTCHPERSEGSAVSPGLRQAWLLGAEFGAFFAANGVEEPVLSEAEGICGSRRQLMQRTSETEHYSNINKNRKTMKLTRWTRFHAILLVVALLGNSLALASKKPVDPAAIKAKIQARGVGQGVRVTFADQTEAKGIIVAINDQTFALKPKNTALLEVEYAKVTGVHNDKLTRGQSVTLVACTVAGALIITGVVLTVSFERGFGKGLNTIKF